MPRAKKETAQKIEEKQPVRNKKEKFFVGTGRRKSAVASVFLYPKKGDFIVNDKSLTDYFDKEDHKISWLKPFHLIGVSHPSSVFSATVKVSGSGKSSQFDAMVLGFSKALLASDPEFRTLLRKNGMLTRDSREVERKKYFLRKARKKPQYSKR